MGEMEMQSTSLKTARAPFDAGMVRAFITIVSAFALVAGLVLALTIIRGQPGTPVVSKAAADQALIDFRAGERSLLTPQEQADAEHQAFLDVVAAERIDAESGWAGSAAEAIRQAIAELEQEKLEKAGRADALRWQARAQFYGFGATKASDWQALEDYFGGGGSRGASAGGGGGLRFPQ